MGKGTLADVDVLDRFSSAYFDWICDWMDPEGRYSALLKRLYELEYTWILPEDGNRAENGCNLRVRFEETSGMECRADYVEDWPCSILEMLALATRIDDLIMYDFSAGDRTADWFWEMIENMGLYTCTDSEWKHAPRQVSEYVNERVDIFLNRKYGPDGTGGSIFPVPGLRDLDFRNEEIWLQMYRYFNEKVDIS